MGAGHTFAVMTSASSWQILSQECINNGAAKEVFPYCSRMHMRTHAQQTQTCVQAHIHTSAHANMYTRARAHANARARVRAQAHARTHTRMQARMHARMHARTQVRAHVCTQYSHVQAHRRMQVHARYRLARIHTSNHTPSISQCEVLPSLGNAIVYWAYLGT